MNRLLIPSVGCQRVLVFVSVFALVAAALLWPSTGDRAAGQAQSAAKQPYNCGTQRNSLALSNAGSGATMYPCLSGVMWRMQAGSLAGSDITKVVATIDGASAPGTATVKYAASGVQQTLYHVAFSNLTFCSVLNSVPVNPCQPPVAGGSTAGDWQQLRLTAASSTVPAPGPSVPYTWTIDPDVAMTVGGNGVWTDLWATGDSTITVRLQDVDTAAGLLGVLTGNGAGTCDEAALLADPDPIRHGGSPGFLGIGGNNNGTCEIKVQAFNQLNWLVGGSGFRITGMDIKFAYLATHTASVTDPYNPSQAPTGAAIQLPATTIEVQ